MYGRNRQATRKNIIRLRKHAYFVLDNLCYKNTLRICSIYCFSSATVDKRRRFRITLYSISCLAKLSGKPYNLRMNCIEYRTKGTFLHLVLSKVFLSPRVTYG